MLTDGPLTGGGHVAGTGTIDPDGEVGPIGGIQQKLLGASSAGAHAVPGPARATATRCVGHIPDGLTVVPVTTLTQAVDVVETWCRSDRPVPHVSARG